MNARRLIEEVLESCPPPPAVSVAIDDGTPVIDGDWALLFQILVNLLTNAYQAMPNGGAVVVSTAAEGTEDVITVDDSGIGVDPEILDRAFEPFVTTKAHGTGLGLPIIARLVEAQHGAVALENLATGGARATIRLPRRAAADR